jgi:small subunit ribosomal protein S1
VTGGNSVIRIKQRDVLLRDGEGTVTRITPFGAFVQLSPAVEALVHVSELGEGDGADPEKVFKLNERKNFRVLDVDKDNRKISLSLKKAK